MKLLVAPKHLGRYRDISRLLIRYGRSDLVRDLDIEGLESSVADSPDGADATAERLADDLEAMGPTFIKLGQLLSTRVDLLPKAYTDALSRLQDRVAPFPYDEVAEIIAEEIGTDIGHAFQSFERHPLAAASLGQVHRAVTRGGQDVVVKVQRPGIREQVRDDLDALVSLAELIDKHTDVGRRYGFTELLEAFGRSLTAELDYRREAANLVTMGRILAPWDRLVVPQPVADYSTSKVLTMDAIEGRNVTTIGQLGRTDLDGKPLVDDLFRGYLQQILIEGVFHADPHPGNVLVTPDNRLALIDLGMVSTLSAAHQDSIVRLLLAVSDGNGEAAADALTTLGRPGPEFDTDRFKALVSDLVFHAVQMGSRLQAGLVVLELTRISAQCGMRVPPELSLVGKALLNLDQVAQCLDPTFVPADAIRRHTTAILQSRLQTSTGSLLTAAMEAKDFTMQLPGRLNKVMDAFGEGKFQLKVNAIDEPQFLAVMQRLANRMASAMVIAALVVGAALMMQVPTKSHLLGYPSIAVVCFLLAAAGGAALLSTIVLADRRIARTARRRRSQQTR